MCKRTQLDLFEGQAYDVCINCSGAASVPESLTAPFRDFSLNAINVKHASARNTTITNATPTYRRKKRSGGGERRNEAAAAAKEETKRQRRWRKKRSGGEEEETNCGRGGKTKRRRKK